MIKEILSSALLALMTTSAWAQENDTKTNEWAPKDHVKISINAGPQWNSSLGCLAGVDVHIPLAMFNMTKNNIGVGITVGYQF